MLTAIGLCLAGVVSLALGADFISRGGSALAARLGVPPIIIGLTIVAIGTSAPELAIGIDASSRGNGSLALGNVAGANIINILLVLGVSALLQPLVLRLHTLRLVLPAAVAAAFSLVAIASDGRLSPSEGVGLLTAALLYTVGVVWLAVGESRAARRQFDLEFSVPDLPAAGTARELAWSILLLGAGIVVVLVASDWFVLGAVQIARLWGVTDAFVGVTIVALGTTSPELATTIISTLKKQRDIGLGNLLGSCVYNILLILGVSVVVAEEGIAVSQELLWLDLPVMALSLLLCVPIFLTGRRITRWEGGALVGGYAVFLGYLIATRT